MLSTAVPETTDETLFDFLISQRVDAVLMATPATPPMSSWALP
jgi:hypothetical protein